jgi:hypothetical protein
MNKQLESTDYLTYKDIEIIDNWAIRSRQDCEQLLDFVMPLFDKHGFVKLTKYRYYISTGGWSGCEEVIYLLRKKPVFWALSWLSSARGGHYIFEIRVKGQHENT